MTWAAKAAAKLRTVMVPARTRELQQRFDAESTAIRQTIAGGLRAADGSAEQRSKGHSK